MDSKGKISLLLKKGVTIPLPDTVFISEEVDISRVSGNNVTLWPGTRIMGSNTLIMDNSEIGREAPVTLDDVFVGPGSRLHGGFFQRCAFAGRNSFGSGAHVREGTILEEEAGAAHTVGLKQTILFPFVTLGSLINFCDCFMAGGTSRKDHSEVGSSFIHFNYTPNQDKATPSMMGNVHHGVMLRSRPIFLGGQGGLVGPCRITFGSVTAAGTIWRRDMEDPDRLVFGGGFKEAVLTRKEGIYSNVKRIYNNNCLYITSLCALMLWYRHIRALFVHDYFSEQLLIGMQKTLVHAISERINRLGGFIGKLENSRELIISGNGGKLSRIVEDHDHLIANWPDLNVDFNKIIELISGENIEGQLPEEKNSGLLRLTPPDSLMEAIKIGIKNLGYDYTGVIKKLDSPCVEVGSAWLGSIVNSLNERLCFA